MCVMVKKLRNKGISIFLALALCCLMVPSVAFAEGEDALQNEGDSLGVLATNDFSYVIKNGEYGNGAYIQSYNGTAVDVVVPATIAGADVVSVNLESSKARLRSLDVSSCVNLKSLNCANNRLRTLNVSANPALIYLNCEGNVLTDLDVTNNTKLVELECSSNILSTLDISKNTDLSILYCRDNRLSTLDVSKNTKLDELSCYYNYFPSNSPLHNWGPSKGIPDPVIMQNDPLRLEGGTRYGTMSDIVEKTFSSSSTVIVTTGANYPDALAASGLAGLKGDVPIVLTPKAELCWETERTLLYLNATKVILIGSEEAISGDVEKAIKQLGIFTERIAGKTRVETALEIYKSSTGWSTTAIIACGQNFPDALSISSYSYAKKMPIFLTDGNKVLTNEVLSTITGGNFTDVIILGSDAAVSEQVEKQLTGKGFKADKIVRLQGSDRFMTSVKIAEYAIANRMTADNMALSTGYNFPDALAGSAFCGKNSSVIMLVGNNITESDHAATFITKNKGSINTIYAFGSMHAVSSHVYDQMKESCK